ncbi:MAG: hypothetical protein ABIH39_06255 [Candidatus Margulisiibacteriota bacterium]
MAISAQLIETDLHWLRTKADSTDCDCVAIFYANGYRCEQICIDGSRESLKQKNYPLSITGSDVRLGFKYSGTAMFAGSLYLRNRNGAQYKITVAPVTGKVTLIKL